MVTTYIKITSKQRSRLKELYREGAELEEIADITNLPLNTVHKYLSTLSPFSKDKPLRCTECGAICLHPCLACKSRKAKKHG